MAENTQTLFAPATETPNLGNGSVLNNSPLTWWSGLGLDMSQNEKDAIMRQIHPIFLTTHSEEKTPIRDSNFDKFLGFMRLCLEWLLKLVDIIVDALIQIARLAVWIVAISGVLIVVTLMTNTTDKFIGLLNDSVFTPLWIDTRIQKVDTTNSREMAKISADDNDSIVNSEKEYQDSLSSTPTTNNRKIRTIVNDVVDTPLE